MHCINKALQKWYNDLKNEDNKLKEANISIEDVERILTLEPHVK